MPATVEWREVTKRYGSGAGEVLALTGVSLAVGAGEFVAVMGPSGSGKSTLLHLAGGLEPPTSGRVLVRGVDLGSLDAVALAEVRRRHVGYVFQKLNLVPALTAVENVMLPLAAARMPDGEQHERAHAALSRVGLRDKHARLPRDLSGGEQQRVAIARAIVNGAPLLLADEPTGCLDTSTGRAIIDVFLRLRADGQTIFMVTHDPAVAARADRIVRLRDGRLEHAGTAASAA